MVNEDKRYSDLDGIMLAEIEQNSADGEQAQLESDLSFIADASTSEDYDCIVVNSMFLNEQED